MINDSYSIFPLEFLKECVETYTKNHGKRPTTLVASEQDIFDWNVTCTIGIAAQLNIKIISGTYLKPGQFDLCMGLKDKKKKK